MITLERYGNKFCAASITLQLSDDPERC